MYYLNLYKTLHKRLVITFIYQVIILKLYFICTFFRGLSGSDVLSKSDPMCVTYVQPFGQNKWIEFHRTESVKNNQDPNFVSKVMISYKFEEKQPLLFEIYDTDSKDKDLSAHDFLGTITTTLGQLIATKRVS